MRKKALSITLSILSILSLVNAQSSNAATIKTVTKNIGVVNYKADYSSSITLTVGKDDIPFSYSTTQSYEDDKYYGELKAKTITLTPANSEYETLSKQVSNTVSKNGYESKDNNVFTTTNQYNDSSGYKGILNRTSVSWINGALGSSKEMTAYHLGAYVSNGNGLPSSIIRQDSNGNSATLYLQSTWWSDEKKSVIHSESNGYWKEYDKVGNTKLGYMSNNSTTYWSGAYKFNDAKPRPPVDYYGPEEDKTGWKLVEYRWADDAVKNADWVIDWIPNVVVFQNGEYWWRSESGILNKWRRGVYLKYEKEIVKIQYGGTYKGTYRPQLYNGTATYSGTATKQNNIATKWNATVNYEGEVEQKGVNTEITLNSGKEFRTNTDVILGVTLKSDKDITATRYGKAEFTFNGAGKQTVNNIVIPKNDKQIIWVKWRTPSNPSQVKLDIALSGGIATKTVSFTLDIVRLDEKTPPDTVYEENAPKDFRIITPSYTEPKTTANWYEYTWENGTFKKNNYSVSLINSFDVTPDESVKTSKSVYTDYQIGSGYGFNEKVQTSISASDNLRVTPIQNVVSQYPEFMYETYNRHLENTSSNGLSKTYELKQNEFSLYKSRLHFTPMWYPDGDYVVNAYIFDCWTPIGQLYDYKTDKLIIRGSMYDDWHVSKY